MKWELIVALSLISFSHTFTVENNCKFSAFSFLGNSVFKDITKNAKSIKTKGKTASFLYEFKFRYKNMFALLSEEASKTEFEHIKKWAEKVRVELSDSEKVLLVRAMRREFVILIRDLGVDKDIIKAAENKMAFFEAFFKSEVPFLSEVFCFDGEFLRSPEARDFEETFLKLKKLETKIDTYSKDLEEELKENIKKHPVLAEHWYNYAIFLLSLDKIKETIEFLEKMLKRFPDYDKAKKLKNYCAEISKIKDPLMRAKKIESFIMIERQAGSH